MRIEIIKCLKDNFSYLIIDEQNNSACVIDPSEASPIIDHVEKLKLNLKFILNTHHHFCLLYTSPSPRDRTRSRMPSSA